MIWSDEQWARANVPQKALTDALAGHGVKVEGWVNGKPEVSGVGEWDTICGLADDVLAGRPIKTPEKKTGKKTSPPKEKPEKKSKAKKEPKEGLVKAEKKPKKKRGRKKKKDKEG